MTENLILLAFLFGAVLIYAVLDPRPNAVHDLQTSFDRHVPFLPVFIVPYFGLFIFIPVSILLLIGTPLAREYIAALVVAMYAGALVWYFFPTKMHQPHVLENDIFHKLTTLLYHGDPHANGFPSAHVFSSFISAYYLSVEFPAFASVAWLAGVLVAVSTMFVKRHQLSDVISGILWAVGAIALVRYFSPF